MVAEVECVPATFVYWDDAIFGFGVDALEPTYGERDEMDWSGIDGMTNGDGVDAVVFVIDGVDPTTCGDGVDAVAFATDGIDPWVKHEVVVVGWVDDGFRLFIRDNNFIT